MEKKLLQLHNPDGIERVGFVLANCSIVEVPNISPEPLISFMVQGKDIQKYALSGMASGTWHTHPKKDANLTVEDNQMFLNYPELEHYIIGTDGVRKYRVEKGMVVNA